MELSTPTILTLVTIACIIGASISANPSTSVYLTFGAIVFGLALLSNL